MKKFLVVALSAASAAAVLAPLAPAAAATALPAAPAAPAATACATSIPDVGARYMNKVSAKTTQVLVSRGEGGKSFYNRMDSYEKINGCWTFLRSYDSFNGNNGWSKRPKSGAMKSPIGTFSLTDAGGRLPNPGTGMKYHYGPQAYEAGGYKMSYPVQIFNYVIAINYNRKVGNTPRNLKTLSSKTGSGYWIHQNGLGTTKGCLGLSKGQLEETLQWLKKSAHPKIIMGPQADIGV